MCSTVRQISPGSCVLAKETELKQLCLHGVVLLVAHIVYNVRSDSSLSPDIFKPVLDIT